MINLLLILLTISLSVIWFWRWATKNHDFFEKQGLKFEKPLPLIGNSCYILTGDYMEGIQWNYSMFPDEKIVGVFEFLKPAYLLRSPEIIRQLIVKDFSHFQDHVSFTTEDESEDFFANILFSMKGKQWRDMRSSLSPMFTGRKMRIMLDLITKCSEQMCDYLREDYEKNGPTPQPMKVLFSKYTIDVIATCAFGVEVNSFKSPDNDIFKISQKIVGGSSGKVTFIQFVMLFIPRLLPRFGNILKMKFISDDVKIKFTELITHTMEVRKKENIQRPDMLQLLMRLKEGQLPKEKEMDDIDPENKMINGEFKTNWTDTELIAQCFQFFMAGFHTTSSVLTFCSHALAVNPDLQEKLITEVDETYESLNGNPLTYEIIMKMKYMDMFISEVLRMWPPITSSSRECIKAYAYEDEDGHKFTIKEGTVLYIPIHALHMDPKYFPNPNKFDPERFSDEKKHNINIHAYLPFGVGPRNCIAFRFALMEMKAVIFLLLLNFRLTVCKTTQIPLEITPSLFGLLPKGEVDLKFIPRDDKKVV